MSDMSWIDIFAVLFIGIGPIKVLLVFMDVTQGVEPKVRRQVALRTVILAGSIGLVLLAFGALLQSILHFSLGALSIAGGLILVILSIRIVLATGGKTPESQAQKDPMSMVASPLCIPLMLTPTGIVALITLSGEAVKIVDGLIIAGMIAGIMMFNLFALNISGSFAKYLSKSLIDLMERVLGVLLAALAVQLILNGLADLGIITLTSH